MFDYFIITICNSRILEKKHQQSKKKSYYSAKPRVIFLSRPMIRPRGKDSISEYKEKVWFNCYCEQSHVEKTSRQFSKTVKNIFKKVLVNFFI